MADEKPKSLLRDIFPNVAWDALKGAAVYLYSIGIAGILGIVVAIDQWSRNHLDILFILGLVAFSSMLLIGGVLIQRAAGDHRPLPAKAVAVEAAASVRIPYTRPKPKVTPPENRIFVSITTAELTRMFDGHTVMQGKKLVGAYVGKWMTVTQAVKQVMEPNESFVMVVLRDNETYLQFDPDQWADRLSVIRPGETVTVMGEIDEINQTHIMLKHCELVYQATTPNQAPTKPGSPAPPPSPE